LNHPEQKNIFKLRIKMLILFLNLQNQLNQNPPNPPKALVRFPTPGKCFVSSDVKLPLAPETTFFKASSGLS
jgi:hypothetical protein